jgi:hypothetical protein
MAVPFDPQRLAVMGPTVPVVEGVRQDPASGAAQYSFSTTGSLVYIPGAPRSARQNSLVWVSRNGSEQRMRQIGAIMKSKAVACILFGYALTQWRKYFMRPTCPSICICSRDRDVDIDGIGPALPQCRSL